MDLEIEEQIELSVGEILTELSNGSFASEDEAWEAACGAISDFLETI
ncbi:hypothetical protein [Streptomyces sp. NPDC058572]